MCVYVCGRTCMCVCICVRVCAYVRAYMCVRIRAHVCKQALEYLWTVRRGWASACRHACVTGLWSALPFARPSGIVAQLAVLAADLPHKGTRSSSARSESSLR